MDEVKWSLVRHHWLVCPYHRVKKKPTAKLVESRVARVTENDLQLVTFRPSKVHRRSPIVATAGICKLICHPEAPKTASRRAADVCERYTGSSHQRAF